MKKTLSLFMSVMLIFTSIFSLTANASSIQIKQATLIMDTESAQSAVLSYSNGNTTLLLDGKDSSFGVKSTAPALQTVEPSFEGYSNVIRVKKSSSKNPYLNIGLKDADGAKIQSGLVEIETKLMMTGEMDAEKRNFRIIHTGGSSGGTAQKLSSGFIPDVWYDAKWSIDMDSTSRNVKLTFIPELSAESSAEVENYTIGYTYSYAQADISYLRVDLLPASTSDSLYMANLKAVHYPGSTYNKAEILSVGSDGEVMYNQNSIPLRLSEDIPGITPRDISIKTHEGSEVEVSEVSITSDGSEYVADITTAYPLAANTQYTLTVLARAWGSFSTQVEDGTEGSVTDISIDFYTPAAPVQIKPSTVYADMESAELVKLTYDSGNSKITIDDNNIGQVASTSNTLQSVLESFEGYNNVIKITRSSSKTPYISINTRGKDGTSFKEGKYTLSAKIRSNEAIDSGKRVFRIVNTGGSSEGTYVAVYKDTDSVKWIPDVWYDVVWTIDMSKASNNVSLVFTPEIPDASAEEIAANTISHKYSYAKSDISYFRIDFLPATNGSGEVYWANLALTSSSDEEYIDKAEIVSVGEDGKVMYNQNEINFKLSCEIPGLSSRHILVKDADGQAVNVLSLEATDNGDGYDVTVITEEPLAGWTDYNLTISANAWGKASVQIDAGGEGEVTDVTVPFSTPSAPYDIKKPVFTLDGDNFCVDTALINTTGAPMDITLSIVVYGADGRVKSVNPVSYNDFVSGENGEEVHLEAPFIEGDTAKIMAINGWEKMTSLFGKHWVVSYDELG